MLPEKRPYRSSSLDMFSSSAPERGFASRLGGGHGCKRIDGFRDSSAVFDACADPLHCWHHVEQQYGRAGFDWRLSKVSAAPMRWRTIGKHRLRDCAEAKEAKCGDAERRCVDPGLKGEWRRSVDGISELLFHIFFRQACQNRIQQTCGSESSISAPL